MTDPAPEPGAAAPSGLAGRVREQFAKREFLRHFATLLSGTAVSQVLMILGTLVVARLFSPEEVGAYGAIMAICQAIVPLAALRYDMAIVLPRRDNDARMLVRLASRINVAVAVVATVVLLLFGDRISGWVNLQPSHQWLLIFVGPITWLLAQVVILTYWLTRTKNFRTVSENKVTNAVAVSATQIAAGLLRWGVLGLMVATILGQALTLLNLLRRTRGQFAIDGPHASLRELMREYRTMPLLNGPNALVDSARLQGVPLLISARFGSDTSGLGPTGQFYMAWRLLQAPISLINGAVTQIFFQKLSVTRRGAMFALIRQTVLRSILLGLVPFGLIWLLAPWLLPLVLGGAWTPAGQIARALVPWLFLNFLTSPISTVFVVARRQALMLVYAIAFAAVPLTILLRTQSDLVTTIEHVAWAMAGMLTLFIALALWVARQFDRGVGGSSEVDDDEPSEAFEADLAERATHPDETHEP